VQKVLPPNSRTPRFRRLVLRCGLAASGGLLHACGWLFPGAWPAVWIGQAAMVSLGAVCRTREAFCYGFLLGVIGIGISFYWGAEALKHTFNTLPVVAWSAFVLLVALEAAAIGLFCTFVSLFSRRGQLGLWLIPCAWVATEHWWPRVFPWKLSYTQLEATPLLQIAELAGPTAVSFVMTAAVTIPTAFLAAMRGSRSAPRFQPVAFAVASGTLLAATLIYGQVRIWQWSNWLPSQPKLKVGLIQVDPILAGSEARLREGSLAMKDRVDLICWPESSLGTYSERLTHFRDPDQTALLSRDSQDAIEVTTGLNRYLLAGAKSYRDESDYDCPYAVIALLVSPEQQIVGRYHKQTLLPLGEYIPGERMFPALRRWADLNQNLQVGSNATPLRMNGTKLGVLICYEDTLVGSARKTVSQGAEALFCLINAAAFNNPLTLQQHYRLAALRAVENRRYFVRCASTGVTCVIDPIGRIIAQLPPQTEGTLQAEIATVRVRSFFNRIGDAFPLLCTALVAFALAVPLISGRG